MRENVQCAALQAEKTTFGSAGIMIANALDSVKRNHAAMLLIPRGVYHIYADDCTAPVICPANHGFNGFRPTAFFLDEMSDFTLDGQGSTFILHGVMDFSVIRNSHHITIRNLTVTYADSCNFQGNVLSSSRERVQIALENPPVIELHGDTLMERFRQDYNLITRTLEYMSETKEIRTGTGDDNFGIPFERLHKSLNNNILSLYEVPNPPLVGNTIVFALSRRCGQAFFSEKSKDIVFENITVHTCYGMAFIAQKCENLTIRSCCVTPDEGKYWSAGQDASHFANCRGEITVESCLFENQLDDAVNIHGIYTLLEKKEGDRALVSYPHWQTRGIEIFAAGNTIQFQDQRTQKPTGTALVAAVRVLNPVKTILTLKMGTGFCREGQIVENLSDQPNACIRNNTFHNNRARGMLIASKGKIEISGNRFHTNHSAINFESDPLRWFEAGSTKNVSIHDNFFDDCLQNRVSRAVIDICERPEMPEDYYYHETIAIRHNRFTQEKGACVFASSVRNLVFEGNEYQCETPILAVHSWVNGKKSQ